MLVFTELHVVESTKFRVSVRGYNHNEEVNGDGTIVRQPDFFAGKHEPHRRRRH